MSTDSNDSESAVCLSARTHFSLSLTLEDSLLIALFHEESKPFLRETNVNLCSWFRVQTLRLSSRLQSATTRPSKTSSVEHTLSPFDLAAEREQTCNRLTIDLIRRSGEFSFDSPI